MNATRCISYLTIEHRGEIAEELMAGMGRQIFGCDICQDVCPWNGKLVRSLARDGHEHGHGRGVGDAAGQGSVQESDLARRDMEPRPELVNPALEWLAGLDMAEYELRFNGSPVRRAGFMGLRRNVVIAMGNSGLGRYAAWLEQWAEAADEGLRTAARWALKACRRSWIS